MELSLQPHSLYGNSTESPEQSITKRPLDLEFSINKDNEEEEMSLGLTENKFSYKSSKNDSHTEKSSDQIAHSINISVFSLNEANPISLSNNFFRKESPTKTNEDQSTGKFINYFQTQNCNVNLNKLIKGFISGVYLTDSKNIHKCLEPLDENSAEKLNSNLSNAASVDIFNKNMESTDPSIAKLTSSFESAGTQDILFFRRLCQYVVEKFNDSDKDH